MQRLKPLNVTLNVLQCCVEAPRASMSTSMSEVTAVRKLFSDTINVLEYVMVGLAVSIATLKVQCVRYGQKFSLTYSKIIKHSTECGEVSVLTLYQRRLCIVLQQYLLR